MATRLLYGWAVLVLLVQAGPAWGQRWLDSATFLQGLPARSRLAPRPYLPLEVGNQWIYVQKGRLAGDPVTMEVTASAVFNGNTYFQLTNYAEAPAWVRYNAAGELVQYDPGGGPERLWYSFAAAEGTSWRSQLSLSCPQAASITARGAEVKVPAGAFSPSLVVQYGAGACADAGLSDETFAPGVGLLRRTAVTIAGPRTFELTYARVGLVSLAGAELAFSVSIDGPAYVADLMPPVDPARAVPVLTARFTLRNTSSVPVNLDFNTGQQYDLVIRDSSGREVYQWSRGKLFTQVVSRLTIGPGEKNFVVPVPLGSADSQPFAAGRYTLEAWLTTAGGKVYTATVGFEVQRVN